MFTFSASGGWFDGSYCDKIRAAAKNGFKAYEILTWTDIDLDEAAKCLTETGMTLSAIAFNSRDPEKSRLIGFGHGITHEDSHAAFIDAMKESLEAAKKLNVKTIVVTVGLERSDVSRGYQHDNIVKALKTGAEVLRGSGIKIALEPLNVLVNHKGYYLQTSDEGAEIIKEVGCPEVTLLFDIYHQQITEGNLINNIKKHIGCIGHFHVGDVPGRREPGTGEINYKNVFRAIAETGYSGYVAFECGRSEDAETVCCKMLSILD